MKKLLFLFAVLLSTVSAWAQTETLTLSTSITNPENQYFMKNGNGVWMDSETVNCSANESMGQLAFFDAGTGNVGDVLIYSVNAQKWISYTKSASYSNGRNFASLVEASTLEDAKTSVNPWRYSMVNVSGVGDVYQFAPHNNTAVASKYMNWFQGPNGTAKVGIYESGAANDNGSRWILESVPESPTSQAMYYLKDKHGTFLSLSKQNNTLATVTSVPDGMYITVDASTGAWSIHTAAEGGNYLSANAYNTQISTSEFKWVPEYVYDGGELYIKIKNNTTNSTGYLGNESHVDGMPLYANKNDADALKIRLLSASDLEGQPYMIVDGYYVLQCPHKDNVYAQYDGTRIVHSAKANLNLATGAFRITKGEGNKYAIQFVDGNYITYKGTGQGDQLTVSAPADATDANKWWVIRQAKTIGRLTIVPFQDNITNTTNGFNFSVSYNNDNNGALGLYQCDDDNSQWTITPAVPLLKTSYAKFAVAGIYAKVDGENIRRADNASDAEVFTFVQDASTNKYEIKTSTGQYLTYTGTGVDTAVNVKDASDATDTNKWWVILPNRGTSGSSSNAVDIYPYNASFSEGNPTFNWCISLNNNTNAGLGFWYSDNGSSYAEIYWEVETSLTDMAGNVHSGSCYHSPLGEDVSVNGVFGYSLSNQCWSNGSFTADVTFPITVSKTDESADNLLLITPFSEENTLKYYVENDNVKVSNSALTSTNVDNYQWAIYPTLTGNEFSFVIKNHGTGKFIKTNKTVSSNSKDDEGAVTVVEKIDEPTAFTLEANNRFKIPGYELSMSVTSATTSTQFVTVHNSTGGSGQHAGVNNHFTVVSDIINDWKEMYLAKLNYVGSYSANLTEEIGSVSTYAEKLRFEENNSKLVLGEGYYYIKGTGDGNEKNWYAKNVEGSFKAISGEPASAHIFRLEKVEDGCYKMESFLNGKFVKLVAAAPASTIDQNVSGATIFKFYDSESCKFTIKGVFENQDKTTTEHFMRTENDGRINYWDTESNEKWYLIEAAELPVVIHSTGYSTFSAAVDVEVPDGVNAYYAKSYDADKVRMSPIQQIPANEGVVIQGTGSATVNFPIISNAAALLVDNLLKAHLNTEAVTPEDGNSVFILATKGSATGFYPLSANNTIAGHKSYLEIPTPQAARLSIVWDDTETGIHEAEGGEQNVEIYDLTGRRLDKPAKGVNIIGGKLVIK